MKTVYVATYGSYSDYSIGGVFSTKENASKHMAEFPSREWNDIEEYEVDSTIKEIGDGKTLYRVRMQKDGKFLEIERSEYIACDENKYHWYEQTYRGPCEPWTNFYVWARDEKTAIKISNDRRIAALATETV